jgi:protein-disulfide isomerase
MELYSDPRPPISPVFETRPRPTKRWYQRWWGRLLVTVATLLLIFLIAFAFYIFNLVRQLQNDPSLANPGASGDRVDLSALIDPTDPTLGPRNAKVVVVEFSDFQCPFCGQSYPVVKQLLQNYGDQILFVYKDFPRQDIHPQAVQAALAGQCAHEQGQFWLMHDKLFENQANLADADLKRYAVQSGLNSIQFGTCLQNGKYLGAIQQDFNTGLAAGVNSTPTFFINGIGVRGAVPLATLEQIIVAELNR